jgi:hypothetical protein
MRVVRFDREAVEREERERLLEEIRGLDENLVRRRAYLAELRAARGNVLRFDAARRVVTSPRAAGPRGAA